MVGCKSCGKCCRTFVTSEAYDEEALRLKRGYKGKVKYKGDTYHIFDLPCIYIDKNNKCMIYDERPKGCRNFPGPAFSEFWKLINPKCGMIEKYVPHYSKTGELINAE